MDAPARINAVSRKVVNQVVEQDVAAWVEIRGSEPPGDLIGPGVGEVFRPKEAVEFFGVAIAEIVEQTHGQLTTYAPCPTHPRSHDCFPRGQWQHPTHDFRGGPNCSFWEGCEWNSHHTKPDS